MGNNVIETLAGAVVLVVAGFFMWFAYTGTHFSQTQGYPLYAQFDRIDGLNTGSDVKISGVKVGIVSHQELDPKTFMAKVQVTVDSSIQLPKDSIAEIVSDGLLGGKYLALVPGGDDETLKPNEMIRHTQASVSLESMIGQLIFSKDEDKKEKEKAGAKKDEVKDSNKDSNGPRP